MPSFATLSAIASHPLAIVGYLVLGGAWIAFLYKRSQARAFLRALELVPANERAALANKAGLSWDELKGLSSAGRLRLMHAKYLFLAYIATLVGITLIVIAILLKTS